MADSCRSVSLPLRDDPFTGRCFAIDLAPLLTHEPHSVAGDGVVFRSVRTSYWYRWPALNGVAGGTAR